MDTGIRKLSNLILYSSLWIAICAAAQVQFTYDITGLTGGIDTYTLFVLSSTLVLYSIHRIVGIRRVKAFENVGRFAVISHYKSHILVYGALGVIATAWLFFQLPRQTWYYLAAPVFISAAYVIPYKPGKSRLRDIPFVKIFLIAASWSLITTTVPLLHQGYTGDFLGAIFIERFLFIIAITIPFDIRDFHVDQQARVPTLPHLLGVRRSILMALTVLAVSAAFTIWLISQGVYGKGMLSGYLFVVLVTGVLIYFSRPDLDDHYYSGLLDGTMFLMAYVIWALS